MRKIKCGSYRYEERRKEQANNAQQFQRAWCWAHWRSCFSILKKFDYFL
jgi:hypothetical protein